MSMVEKPAVKIWSELYESHPTVPQHHQTLMQFENGYTISFVYGAATYSRDWNSMEFPRKFEKEQAWASGVEVAIFDPNNEPIPFKDGQGIKGWVTPDELADIIHWVKNLKKENA